MIISSRYLLVFSLTLLLCIPGVYAGDNDNSRSYDSAKVKRLVTTSRTKNSIIVQSDNVHNSRLAREKEIKLFILSGYSYIASDILAGSGEYLDSLFSILKVDKDLKSTHLRIIKSMLLEQKSVSKFASAITLKYLGEYKEVTASR